MKSQIILKENKIIAMLEFLRQCPVLSEQLNTFLHTNISSETLNNASFNTIYSDNWVKKYLFGHGIKAFDFAITLMLPFDKNHTDFNAHQLEISQNFMDWIDEQEKNKNYPKFDNCEIQKIENLQNMPNLAGINQSGDIAKYMFQCKITYYT